MISRDMRTAKNSIYQPDILGWIFAGAACNPSVVPLGTTAFKLHDAVDQATAPFLSTFPYLATPLPGSQ